jgi:GNAT superfamily N-acetyltransferase
VTREATQKEFVPIGHISLDSRNPGVEKVGVAGSAPGLFWIKTFFVSGAFQSKGIGRAAMDEVESMAVREPLRATVLMLDVIPGEDQMREEFALATYGCIPKVNLPIPAITMPICSL